MKLKKPSFLQVMLMLSPFMLVGWIVAFQYAAWELAAYKISETTSKTGNYAAMIRQNDTESYCALFVEDKIRNSRGPTLVSKYSIYLDHCGVFKWSPDGNQLIASENTENYKGYDFVSHSPTEPQKFFADDYTFDWADWSEERPLGWWEGRKFKWEW